MQMRGTVSPLTSGISRTRYLCRLLDGALSGEVTWPSGGAPPSGDLLASRTHSDRQNHGGKIASTFRKPLVAVHINTFNSNGNSSLQEIPVKMLLSKIPESHGFLQISFFCFQNHMEASSKSFGVPQIGHVIVGFSMINHPAMGVPSSKLTQLWIVGNHHLHR